MAASTAVVDLLVVIMVFFPLLLGLVPPMFQIADATYIRERI